MAKEIERKFLVLNDSYKESASSRSEIAQGYLSAYPHPTVRVRIRDRRGFLTVKSRNHGATRDEWEYEIPYDDALGMLELCDPASIIRKTRYIVGAWEIDEFDGRHKGLTLAEIELRSEDESFELPDFIGEEVTGNPKYYNSSLASAQL